MIRLAFQILISVLLTTAATIAFADPLFGTNPENTGTSNGRFKSRLSPDDYVNAVNQVDTQTKSNLNQQAKDLFPKPNAPTPGIANQPPPPSQPENQAPEYSISNPPQPAQPVGMSPPTPPPAPAQQAGGYPTRPASQPTPDQTTTYTGFGGSSNGSSSPAKSSGSTGLGIKY